MKVAACLVSSESSLPDLEMATLSLGSHMAFPLCTCTAGVSPLLTRTLVLLEKGPILTASFNLNHLLKGSLSKYSHIGG